MFKTQIILALGMLCVAVAVQANVEEHSAEHEHHSAQEGLPVPVEPTGALNAAAEQVQGALTNSQDVVPPHRRIINRVKQIGATVGRKGLEAFRESRPVFNDLGNDLKETAGGVQGKIKSNPHVIKGVNIVKPRYDATRERSVELIGAGSQKAKNLLNRRASHNNNNQVVNHEAPMEHENHMEHQVPVEHEGPAEHEATAPHHPSE